MSDHLVKPVDQDRHCLFVFLPVEEIDERSHYGLDGDILLRHKERRHDVADPQQAFSVAQAVKLLSCPQLPR